MIEAWQGSVAAQAAACSATVSGEVLHTHHEERHGGDLFEATYPITAGGPCTPCFGRRRFTAINAGNGSCTSPRWTTSDVNDCRVTVDINRSGGYFWGTCTVEIFER